LELDGIWKGIGNEKEKTILGIVQNGKEVTLSNCIGTKFQVGGLGNSYFKVDQAYIGCHFPEKITFRVVYVNFNLLNDWANLTGMSYKRDLKKVIPDIHYKVPEPIRIFQNKEFEVYIETIGNFKINRFGQKKAEVSEISYFKVKFLRNEYDIENIFHINYHLRNLLSLATLEPVVPLDFFGYSEASEVIISHKKIKKKVEIFYKPVLSAKFVEEMIPQQMLFNFQEIQVTSQEKIRKWFENAETLKPVFSLYFAVIHNPPPFTEERFLFLIQALEVYHRRTREGKELPEQVHQKRIQQILDAVPQQHIEWLKGKLEYSNELSLRKRLKEIYEEFLCILNSFMKKGSFINLVVDTRNYLTHYDEGLNESCPRGKELFYLSKQLEIILQLCFLKELGFTRDEMELLFKRYQANQVKFLAAPET